MRQKKKPLLKALLDGRGDADRRSDRGGCSDHGGCSTDYCDSARRDTARLDLAVVLAVGARPAAPTNEAVSASVTEEAILGANVSALRADEARGTAAAAGEEEAVAAAAIAG